VVRRKTAQLGGWIVDDHERGGSVWRKEASALRK